jgi:predicted nuclease of restriction endonuclease-like (RecB) superfamily
LRSGWSIRQLDRQIGSQFYERVALSQNKAAMEKAQKSETSDLVTPEVAITVSPFIRN